jgi:hypothetical protein
MPNLIAIAPHFPLSCPDEAGQLTVRIVRHFLVAAAALVLAAVTATAAPAAPKLIYKIDTVSAKTVGKKLVVTATGAVNSGGWSAPLLRLKEVRVAESDTEVIEFLATPPAADAVVVQALIPIAATATFALPPYAVVQVKVVAESNSVTSPIR